MYNMSQKEIIEGNRLLAEYLGWKYFPYKTDSKLQGWYDTVPIREEVPFPLQHPIYNKRNGWEVYGGCFIKFMCKDDEQLRFHKNIHILFIIINKISNECLKEYFRVDGVDYFESIDYTIKEKETVIEVNADKYSSVIGRGEGGTAIENTFKAVVEAVEYINRSKN